ncbi:ATP-binding protein [Chryseobacterium sp. Leaf394]|uniref:ATP-binding protein n=1 Tax=Chryseobacterium sp. Leaf394 TaxID=1736361 RepID=UPI0006FDC110|nr:ATP-binding protein [Chryseobacterium sp. Leaf394]KQS92995.1 hypothetical protein ASG21_11335 [Chryseobacterium sp. Leaf394]
MKKLISLACLTLFLANCSKQSIQSKDQGKDNKSYAKAREFREAGIKDSAFKYYNLAKIKYQEAGDSIGAAQSLINMGRIQTDAGDYFGGIESSLQGDSYLENSRHKNTNTNLTTNYNNIAIAASRLNDYDRAIVYYKKALPYTSGSDKSVLYNNIGDSYIGKADYRKALEILQLAIKDADDLNRARIITNAATAKFRLDSSYNPVSEYREALQIRITKNNLTELNSSYAALSDFYKSKNKDSALFYGKKMLEAASSINNPDDKLQALQKILTLDQYNSSHYLKTFFSLNDSLVMTRANAKNQFALVRADIAETEAKNADLLAQKLKIENQLIYNIVIIVILCTALIFGTIYYQKRKKLQQQEKEIEVKKTEIKYSKKVHDVVANGIYQVMTKIENHQDISRNETLDDLEDVYKKSRNISYDSNDDNTDENFYEKIRKLVSYFKNENTETYLAGNDADLWQNIAPSTRSEIYQILRELLVNMKKHSHADRVILQFRKEQNSIEILYSDNGIGIQNKSFFKKGLQNVVSRIENLNGDIIFDTETEKGLKINLSFPIS